MKFVVTTLLAIPGPFENDSMTEFTIQLDQVSNLISEHRALYFFLQGNLWGREGRAPRNFE